MAMEKLILRGVLYGADKVPDSWFEKVPGGFFKEKDKNGERKDGGSSDNPRNSTSNSRKARAEDFHRESDRHGSEGRSARRNRRSRSSYDGGADDDDDDRYESGKERRRSARDRPERRRRSLDDDRHGYNDGRDSRPRHRDSRMNDRRRYVPEAYDDRDRPPKRESGPPPNPLSPNQHPTVDTRLPRAGPTPAATFPLNRDPSSPVDHSPVQPQSATAANPPSNVYVPYAHIYGQPSPRRASQSRASTKDVGAMPTRVDSVSPPVAPPPIGYKQNPFAQEAPTAVDAGAGAQYNGQPGFINKPIDPRFSTRRHMGYDGAQGSPTDSPPPPRDRYRPDGSTSRDRARDRDSSGRQSRTEGRSVDVQSKE